MATILFKDMKTYPLIATVMVIDDQLTSRIILESIIKTIGSNVSVRSFDNALSALSVAKQEPPDLIIADYKMPEMDGVEFTRQLRASPGCTDVPIIIITIVDDKAVLYEALEAGATDFLPKPIDHYECKVRCRNLLTMRRQQLIIRNRAYSLENHVNDTINQIQNREQDTLELLARTGDYRDNLYAMHTPAVGKVSAIIASAMGMDNEFCETIKVSAALNDIGKIGIPDNILLKENGLNEHEMEKMKTHTTIGYDLLKHSASPFLQMGATIALNHHERFDGDGYPSGLYGENIPVAARIVAVADVFDSLTNRRPFRQEWSMEDATKEILSHKGTKFDPNCVDAFTDHLEEIEEVQEVDEKQQG